MLLNTLRQKYEAVSEDWSGKLFCGMNLEWDYKYRTVDVHMKGYIKKVRKKYQHEMPARPENQPHKHSIPNYGAKVQLTESKDKSNTLGPQDTKRLQKIIGLLLFYVHGVDVKLILTLNELA